MLTFKSYLNKSKNKEQKISLLRSKIEDMLNTVFQTNGIFKFERGVHFQRSKGELTEDEICSIWMNTQKESLGSAISFSDNYKYFWAYIPHFIHSPFYVYAYAFGDCLVNSLYKKYEDGYKDFFEKYYKLLEAGGSIHYQNHLRKFKLNPKRQDFWQLGMNLIKNLMDDLEKFS